MKAVFRFLFGSRCNRHDIRYRSDFCPLCVRAIDVNQKRYDRSPAWTRSEGNWPIRRESA